MGDYFAGRGEAALSETAVLNAEVAVSVSSAVNSYNASILAMAAGSDALLFDLHAFVKEIRSPGIEVGGHSLHGGFQSGFFSPDGLFPTPTGQAVLANELLELLNQEYGTSFPQIDVASVISEDPLFKPSRVQYQRVVSRHPDERPLHRPARTPRKGGRP